MIPPEIIAETKRLLAEGWKFRRIARCLPISRATVAAIAHGTRRDRRQFPSTPGEEVGLPNGPFVRCTGCGAKAQMPCLTCRDRALLALRNAERAFRDCPEPQAESVVDLHPEHAAAYQEVRHTVLGDAIVPSSALGDVSLAADQRADLGDEGLDLLAFDSAEAEFGADLDYLAPSEADLLPKPT